MVATLIFSHESSYMVRQLITVGASGLISIFLERVEAIKWMYDNGQPLSTNKLTMPTRESRQDVKAKGLPDGCLHQGIRTSDHKVIL